MALARGKYPFFPCVGEFHGSSGFPDEKGQVGLHGDVFLIAKPAADHGSNDPDLVVRKPQYIGNSPKVLDDLGGYPDRDDPVIVYPGHTRVGLEKGMVHKGHMVGFFNNHI